MSTSCLDLSDKVALVTGASRGIGRAIALALGSRGAQVLVNYRENQVAADNVAASIQAAGGRAWPVRADVASGADVVSLFVEVRRRFGARLDILVNNAGATIGCHPIASMPEEVWDQCVAVNLKGAFLCTQAAWELLHDGSGRIINLTSISARTGGGPGMSHYAAAKGALSNYTRACAKEFAPRRITVNGIAPGVIDTDFHRRHSQPQDLEDLRQKIPWQQLGTPDDIAGAALFLCSSSASYITGEILEINGGLLMN